MPAGIGHLVDERVVVGVDHLRRHVPLVAVHRIADLARLAIELELAMAAAVFAKWSPGVIVIEE